MEENDIRSKVKNLFTNLANSSKGIVSKEKVIIPKSMTFTKTALPILYSNLILIEDMKFENSNYFLGANGFVTKKIILSSLKHDPNFNLSNCAFRIFPRTYNVNKYKVLDFINQKGKVDVQDMNFKFSAEIFNNLDIVQNKFGEPVRYGDIIMLMHENSHMFIQYVNSTKSLTFSNHDGDATLFSIEPATEIMLNDNQILKAGQPIRLKVAGFNYASQNLFFGLSVPYSTNNKQKDADMNDNDNSNFDDDNIGNESEEEDNENSDDAFSKNNNTQDKLIYDKKNKKYEEKPDLVVEENSRMNWRFVLYNPFTTNEEFINYGDYIRINYCEENRVLGAVSEEKETLKKKGPEDLKKTSYKPRRKESFDLKENILVPDDDEIIIDDINEKDLMFNSEYKNLEFFLSTQTPYNKNSTEDVNSTWILENIYPSMKMQSFIRFYEDEKLDSYRMTFRIRHFKTNKILSIIEAKDDRMGPFKKTVDFAEGNDTKLYKFVLIDNEIEHSFNEQKFLSKEYQYSLFGFKKTNKSKSADSTYPAINDFLKLYHVKTKCYVKIKVSDSKKKAILNLDDLLKCYLTLIKYPDEKEVVKIERIHYNTQWKFKFIQNLYNLVCHIIRNIKQELGEARHQDNDSNNNENNFIDGNRLNLQNKYMDDFFGEENLEVSNFRKLKFIIDKLFKFIMNKFINKYNAYCGFNNIVNHHQLLLSHFDFTKLFLIKLIYFYWLHDGNLGRVQKIGEILYNVGNASEMNNYLNNLSKRDKALYQMFRYTEAIFQFMLVYCKDNSIIKKELYQYLYVLFNFINLSGPCVDVLIEIFKNEESNLNFIIRDCIEKEKFRSTLELLFKEYFPYYKPKIDNQNSFMIDTNSNQNMNNQGIKMITLFDLLIEYIKISKYSFEPKYDSKQIEVNQKLCKCNSFNPREKYIELLITLIHMNDKANIQDNQSYLIKKLIGQYSNNIILDPTVCGEEFNYPPCLISLIYELAKDSQLNDENNTNINEVRMLHQYISQNPNFREERLEETISDSHVPCNSKMYTYIKENRKLSKEDPEKVSAFFEKQKRKFLTLFKNERRKTWNINILDSQQVEFACSIIQFMKNMIQIDLLSPQKEKDFLNFLVSFLRLKYIMFSSEKVSGIILGDMIVKEKSIHERISKTPHEKYISISETWHKIYQIFRHVLINLIEERFYQRESKLAGGDFKHLKSRKPGDPPIVSKDLIENDDKNLMNNITSQDVLVEKDENKESKGINNNDIEVNNDFFKSRDIDKNSDETYEKKNNTNLFDRENWENRNYEIITREDLKKEKKILITKNIVSIFRLLIRKNINYLKNNFINYYLQKANNNYNFVFEEFVQRCIPCLEDGNDNINKLIRRYCEPKIENTFSSSGYINLNNFLDSSKTDDFNFIQNIIISFATSEEEETQEILIGLIYKYFHQRKTLFRDIIQFNEQLLPNNREKVRKEYNNRGQDIKIIFNLFYQNYELNKNRYDEDKPDKIEYFLNILIKETLIVFENIFNYWKAELIFKENSNYDKQKIENMINKIKFIESSIYQPFSQKIFLDNLSQISYFLYYIRNNSGDQSISSLVSILNEHGELYLKMYFSLLNDLMSKGKKISSYFEKKPLYFFTNKNLMSTGLGRASNDKVLSIKNKIFICLILLILLGSVILPRDDKTLNYLINLLDDKKDLLRYDSYTRYLILLLISDIQKMSFSIDYFYIFKKCNEFLHLEYFGTLESNSDYNSEFPICFSTLFLDIIYNVLSFIIYKNKMINETYLDEIIADTFLFLLKKMNVSKGYNFGNKNELNNGQNSKEKIKLLIKLIKTINIMSNVEQLNRVIMLKLDPRNSSNFNNELFSTFNNKIKKSDLKEIKPIVEYFPQPHNLYQLFINNLHELYNDTDHKLTEQRGLRYAKNIFNFYKYILYYITFVDINYFANKGGDQKQKESIKKFIEYVLYGYSHIVNKDDNESKNLDSMDDQRDEMKNLLEQIAFSSFYLLLNQISIVKYFDFCHKDINGLKLEQEQVKDNFNAIFDELDRKIKNIENLRRNKTNIENNFNINTEINYKTTDNSSVNIYILSQLEEIFIYSIIMDVATTIKTKKEEKGDELEGLSSKIVYKTTLKEKEHKLFDHEQLRNILDVIKQMIVQYQNRVPKSKMSLFQNMLNEHKKELHVFERKESTSIIYYILSFLDGKNKTQKEEIFTHFIQKSVDFINNTLNLTNHLTSKRIKHITYLMFIIRKILSFYEKNEGDLTTSDYRKKTLREMQMVIEKTGLIKISLKFINRYDNEKLLPFINAIFKMFCKMLKFGAASNEVVSRAGSNGQKLFFNTFNIKHEFEQVFSFMTETINKKIQTIISNKFLIVRNKKKTLSIQNQLLLDEYGGDIDENILEFLQLLCENHNINLQLYLHKQNNFRRNYDLVTDTQHYLNILFNNFEPFLFNSLCRCFDLLIEMIQGPCFESQLLLINSKLLVTINDLLKYYLISETEQLYQKFPFVQAFNKSEFGYISNSYKESQEEDEYQESTSFKRNFYKMSTKQISLLTYKATVLLLALVDSRNKFDPLYGNMINVISSDTLEKLFTKVYFEHLTLISETNEINDYLIKLSDFNKANNIADRIEDEFDLKQEKISKSANPEEYLILETGFNTYFLWRYYQDYNSTFKNNEYNEIKRSTKCESLIQCFKSLIFFYECLKFIYELFYAILKTICLIIGLIIQLATLGKVKKFNLIRLIFNRKQYQDDYAIKFYEQSTASIEVLKDENVYIIYFFKLPFCNGLNKFEKQLFLENMDRTNSQSKLMCIMKYSDQVKYELESDYKIKEFASKIPILGVILTNIEFWKDLSLLISIILNLLNFLASHYEQESYSLCIDDGKCLEIKKWREIQTLWGISEEDYDKIIRILSLFQCVIGCLIYGEYMVRKSPAIYKSNREQTEELNYTGKRKTFYIWQKTIFEIVTSFSILYYTGVVVFGFLGNYKSNFFFSYLLLEIVTRFKTLQNVLVAIKNPYKELILIFILWIILIYYFSIIGYVWFRDSEFPRPDKDCNSLLKCVATIFHQNNRMDNGISGYLNPRNEKQGKNPFTWRFFYDEIGNLVLKILIVNMISGIIIDNFAALRKRETEMIYDMNNICTICSLKKDKIIKVYKNYGKDYYIHQNVDHFVFNYIFYIIYLYKKEKTELNGMESFIYESAFVQKDITWFPIKKLYIAKPEELEIDSDEEDEDEDSDD